MKYKKREQKHETKKTYYRAWFWKIRLENVYCIYSFIEKQFPQFSNTRIKKKYNSSEGKAEREINFILTNSLDSFLSVITNTKFISKDNKKHRYATTPTWEIVRHKAEIESWVSFSIQLFFNIRRCRSVKQSSRI